jgi:hypothetical protein
LKETGQPSGLTFTPLLATIHLLLEQTIIKKGFEKHIEQEQGALVLLLCQYSPG